MPRAARLVAALAVCAGALGVETLLAQSPNPLPRALSAQRRLVNQRPGEPGPLNDLGNLLFESGRVQAAEEAYRGAIAIDRDFAAARFNLALLLQQRGRHRKARRQLERLLDTAPDHAWAHYQLGTEAARNGRSKRASEHYAKAFRLDESLLEPTVNPHIIANELSTRALLLAYREAGESSLPPHQYDNPERIARLLVPQWTPPPPGEARPQADKPAPRQRQRQRKKGGSGGD